MNYGADATVYRNLRRASSSSVSCEAVETTSKAAPHHYRAASSDPELIVLREFYDNTYPIVQALNPANQLSNSRRSLLNKLCMRFLMLVLVVGLIIYFVLIVKMLQLRSVDSPYYGKKAVSCGTTQAEAREKGCRFDPMSFVWLCPKCYNQTLVDDWISSRPLLLPGQTHWVKSRNETKVQDPEWISEQEIRDGSYDQGWVTWEYHVTHCAWTWEKLVNEVARGGAIDGYVTGLGHTRHCAKMMMKKGINGSDWNSRFDVEFPDCWV